MGKVMPVAHAGQSLCQMINNGKHREKDEVTVDGGAITGLKTSESCVCCEELKKTQSPSAWCSDPLQAVFSSTAGCIQTYSRLCPDLLQAMFSPTAGCILTYSRLYSDLQAVF